MANISRRQFLQRLGPSAALLPHMSPAVLGAFQTGSVGGAQPGTARGNTPLSALDLVIKGGRVIDPAQKISSVMDVAIKGDRIASVAANIPASEARGVFDAGGKIVK